MPAVPLVDRYEPAYLKSGGAKLADGHRGAILIPRSGGANIIAFIVVDEHGRTVASRAFGDVPEPAGRALMRHKLNVGDDTDESPLVEPVVVDDESPLDESPLVEPVEELRLVDAGCCKSEGRKWR